MKNSKIIFLIYFGILVLILYVTNDVPEDEALSSGTFIDNYENVKNYDYHLETIHASETEYFALKDIEYSFADYTFDLEQYPQGICFTDKYLFITSYTKEPDGLGELKVYDKKTGEYLITLGMDDKSHLGGIAFDGENVWVCNSSNMSIERISYDFISLLAEKNKGETLDVCSMVDVYPVENIPSCITFYNGRIWIATHNIWNNSDMGCYYFDKETNSLESLSFYNIPSQVQGIAFGEKGEFYISRSYGRRNPSYLLKYESVFSVNNDVEDYMQIIEMPPCSEEVEVDTEHIYVLFESACETYLTGSDGHGNSVSPLDKILILPIK